MGRLIVPVRSQRAPWTLVIGAGATSLAAAADGEEVALWVGYAALASGVLTIVVTVYVRTLWVAGTISTRSRASADPEVAGTIAVAFVRMTNAERWVAATILRLARDGVLAIRDEAPSTSSAGTGIRGRVFLELIEDPQGLQADAADGDVDASVACALFGDALELGARIPAVRTRDMSYRLEAIARSEAARAARSYVDIVPVRWRRALLAGNLFAVIGGAYTTGAGPQTNAGYLVAGLALVSGAVAFICRVYVLPRWASLGAAGIELRFRADPARLAPTSFRGVAEGEQSLPWAVLFRRHAVVARFAKLAAGSGILPGWYVVDGAFSAERFTACVDTLESRFRMSAPKPDQAMDVGAYQSVMSLERGWSFADGGGFDGVGDGGGGGGGEGGGGGSG